MATKVPFEIDGIPVYEMVFDLTQEDEGFSVISFVESPANEKAFIALSKDLTPETIRLDTIKLSISQEKREVTGVIMRADFPIFRVHPETGAPYYMFISPEMMEAAVDNFMEKGLTHSVSVEHDGKIVEGVFLKNTFLMSPAHRAAYPEFDDVADGSWMGTYKVKNDDVWAAITSGKVQGYSPELIGHLKARQNTEAFRSQAQEILSILNIKNLLNGKKS